MSISAFEHQTVPVGLGRGPSAITAQEAATLARIAQSRPGFCTFGHQSVRLAQYAGLAGMGDRILEILPKVESGEGVPEVGRGVFLRLLRLSGNLKTYTVGNASHDLRRQTLLDVFIAAFFDGVSSLVRAGLLRRYQTTEDDLTLIRGRLLIGRQASAHAMRVDRLACRYDELTADHVWNRGLKAALYAVKPWISSVDLGRRWMELSAALDDVSLISVTAEDLDTLAYDRQAARYAPAIQWATWILRTLSPNLRAGHRQAPGLIFDMNQLFESAIAEMLRRQTIGNGAFRVSVQETGNYLATLANSGGKRAFGLRPDIVIHHGSKVSAIGDTKWSRVGVNSSGHLVPDGAHMYQMQAYASAYPCEQFILIYPWHSELEGARPTVYELPAIGSRRPVVSVVCVDVGSDSLSCPSGSLGSTMLGKAAN